MAGEPIGYADEVEWCYGVRPTFRDEEAFAAAHRRLDEALPGSGAIRERVIAWREAQAIPVEKLEPVLRSLADDFRERTQRLFGLPEGEQVHWELAHDQPWSGFNYYEGDLRSRVAINTDLPVLSTSIAHLVAHEAYPGHHTEHSRKEAGLVRRRGWQEETIFLVGTPQCLLGRGPGRPRPRGHRRRAPRARSWPSTSGPSASPTTPRSWPPCAPPASRSTRCGPTPPGCCTPTALRSTTSSPTSSGGGSSPGPGPTSRSQFLTSETWRAYISCYVEGLPLCRAYVAGDPTRFATLLTEQLVPADLAAAAA